MTPQQEQTLRLQARARGYDKAKEEAYVEFARQKTQTQVAPAPAAEPQPKGDGFFKSIAKDALKTLVVKPATRAGQALTYGYGAVTGNEGLKEGAFQDIEQDLGVLGKYNIEGQKGGTAGVKQVAGDAAKTASYLYTPAKGAQVVKSGFTGAVKQGAIQGAKAGAAGGALYSGGEAALQDKSVKDIALDTAQGAVLGGVTGGAAGAAVPATVRASQQTSQFLKGKAGQIIDDPVKGLQERAVRQVEQKYDELFTGTKSSKKLYTKSTAQGKTPSRFLAEHGFVVEVSNGKVNAQSTIGKIQQQAEPLEDVLDDILKAKDSYMPTQNKISLDDLGLRAKRRMSTETNKASGYSTDQKKAVDSFIVALKEEFGDSVTLSQLNSIKRGQWKQSSVFDATRPSYTNDIHYAIGKEAKEIIEESVSEADIQGLNKYLGDHFDAIKNLQKIDGNAVKGGRLGNYFGRTVGAIAGAQGGPLGSIAGAFAGDYVSSIMQNNYITGPIKRMLLKKVTAGSPVYAQAQQALRQIQEETMNRVANTKALPPPSYIPAGPRTYEQGKAKILDAQKASGRDPKSGKFKRVFLSTAREVNDTLNESTPGLYTTSKHSITYTDKLGKKHVLKNLDRDEAKSWTQYLKEKGMKYTVKTLGAAATAGAIKEGSDR